MSTEWIEKVARAMWEADAAEFDMSARDWEHAKQIDLAGAYEEAARVAADFLSFSTLDEDGPGLEAEWALRYFRDRAGVEYL